MQAAVQAHQAGRLAEAEQAYRQVLSIEPRNPDALHLLGLLAYQVGQMETAVTLIGQAVGVKPNEPIFLINLGQAHRAAGRLELAEITLRRAIQLNRNLPEAHSNLSALLRQLGRLDDAEAAARKALALNPRLAAAVLTLGAVLKDKGDPQAALAQYEQAQKLGSPRHEVLNNIGEALRALGQLDEAARAFEQAIALAPSMALLHWNLSLIHLMQGDWQRGFDEYEWRLRLASAPQYPGKLWDGGDIDGRSILLYTEQGFGDAIQFARYVPLLAKRGAQAVLHCQPPLVRLLKRLKGAAQVIPIDQPPPATDFYAPLMSLPHRFQTTPPHVPGEVPYLHAEPAELEAWQARIAPAAGARNIGLVWAGNRQHANDRNRSIAPELLAPLRDVRDVRWFSLQMNTSSADLGRLGLNIAPLSHDIRDFADSAAAIAALDLLITVDTAPAHLAGALGKPVWVLLPDIPDWRWLLDRSDSVWYPTMRLFRQPARGDWQSVIAEVVQHAKNEK
jgi:tetratricopeptide (TPR) repeat protein